MEGVDTGALSNGASTPDETVNPTEKMEKIAVSPTVEGSNAVLTPISETAFDYDVPTSANHISLPFRHLG